MLNDDGVIDLPFEEVGLQINGADVGLFSGTASIDKDGAVVGLTLDAYTTNKADPLGIPKKVERYIRVPYASKDAVFCSFPELMARELAAVIQRSHEPEIRDKLIDRSVSRLEREWEAA